MTTEIKNKKTAKNFVLITMLFTCMSLLASDTDGTSSPSSVMPAIEESQGNCLSINPGDQPASTNNSIASTVASLSSSSASAAPSSSTQNNDEQDIIQPTPPLAENVFTELLNNYIGTDTWYGPYCVALKENPTILGILRQLTKRELEEAFRNFNSNIQALGFLESYSKENIQGINSRDNSINTIDLQYEILWKVLQKENQNFLSGILHEAKNKRNPKILIKLFPNFIGGHELLFGTPEPLFLHTNFNLNKPYLAALLEDCSTIQPILIHLNQITRMKLFLDLNKAINNFTEFNEDNIDAQSYDGVVSDITVEIQNPNYGKKTVTISAEELKEILNTAKEKIERHSPSKTIPHTQNNVQNNNSSIAPEVPPTIENSLSRFFTQKNILIGGSLGVAAAGCIGYQRNPELFGSYLTNLQNFSAQKFSYLTEQIFKLWGKVTPKIDTVAHSTLYATARPYFTPTNSIMAGSLLGLLVAQTAPIQEKHKKALNFVSLAGIGGTGTYKASKHLGMRNTYALASSVGTSALVTAWHLRPGNTKNQSI